MMPGNSPDDLHGPPGAVPFMRTPFPPYVSGQVPAANLDDYLSKLQPGNPHAVNNHLYANLFHSQSLGHTFGEAGWVNDNWGRPASELPSEGSDFSFVEIGSGCTSEIMGAIVGYYAFIGDGFRFFVEYPILPGARYVNTSSTAWHQVSATKMPNMALTGVSQPNGTQVEHFMAVQLWNDGPFYGLTGNDWWVFLDNEYVGFINADQAHFTQINNDACQASWYGETFDIDGNSTHWMNADMGSGLLPLGGLFTVFPFSLNYKTRAYIRQPTFYTTLFGDDLPPPANVLATTTNTVVYTQTGYDPNCYAGKFTTDGIGSFSPTFFFGGPGGNGPGCM